MAECREDITLNLVTSSCSQCTCDDEITGNECRHSVTIKHLTKSFVLCLSVYEILAWFDCIVLAFARATVQVLNILCIC